MYLGKKRVSSRATEGRPGIHSGTAQEWIPGLRFAPPGMTARVLSEQASARAGLNTL
ncbi:hypothetical protein J2Y55_000922 [Bosea sp. BE125]|nr:hypothetical protein [Bosea sp. BE125]